MNYLLKRIQDKEQYGFVKKNGFIVLGLARAHH